MNERRRAFNSSLCTLTSALPCGSVLNVLVQELKLRALLAYLDAHDVAHGEHTYELVAVDDGKVAAADLLHAFERVVRRVGAVDDGARLAHHVAYGDGRRFELLPDDAVERVALGEDAAELFAAVEYADGPDVSLRHVLGRVERGRRVRHEVRLAFADHLPDGKHRPNSLLCKFKFVCSQEHAHYSRTRAE